MPRHKFEHAWVRVGPDKTWEDHFVKLLGVSIDSQGYLQIRRSRLFWRIGQIRRKSVA